MTTWLLTTGPVLPKGHVRTSKNDPLVDEVEFLQANPHMFNMLMVKKLQYLAPAGAPSGNSDMLPQHDSQAEITNLPKMGLVALKLNMLLKMFLPLLQLKKTL